MKINIILVTFVLATMVITGVTAPPAVRLPFTRRIVIEGTFDVTADGDVIKTVAGMEWHWKRISVPQLTLSDMPLVKVYIKPRPEWIYGDALARPDDAWVDAGDSIYTLPKHSVAYDEGCVFILYKRVIRYPDRTITHIFITGEYKIVVVK